MWRGSGPGHAKRLPGGAPTWSWASITGPVYYDNFFTMGVDNRGEIRRCAELDLEITDTIVEEEQADSFGNVRRGEIKASGVLKHAATMLLRERWEAIWGFDIQPAEPETDVLERCQVLRLARAYRNKQGVRPVVYFLIIRETGRRENEYQRVGQGRIILAYDQPSDFRFESIRGREQLKRKQERRQRQKLSLPEENMWGETEKVAMTLV
ncbi:hypothetical protein FVER14953_20914 [Fusarium verticillioides]|nr:hypothetical protein FVER14953_20914 [Fusarium verticillioides]